MDRYKCVLTANNEVGEIFRTRTGADRIYFDFVAFDSMEIKPLEWGEFKTFGSVEELVAARDGSNDGSD